MKKSAGLFLLVFSLLIAISGFSSVLAQPSFSCSPGAFIIHGRVINSTFGNASTFPDLTVNVSLYNISFANGEPKKTLLNTTNTTNPYGNFSMLANFSSGPGPGNGCFQQFVMEVVIYNRSSQVPVEIGPVFPPLSKQDFINVLDNTTIYTSNATLLNLTAVNSSWGGANNISFNYIIFDDALGFPIAENFATAVLNATVVVPANRNYTVLFMKAPSGNDLSNAVPPIPYAVVTNTSVNPVQVTGNLTFSMFNITGIINVTGNRTAVNLTNILIKLGIGGLMPPNAEISAMTGSPTIFNMSGGSEAAGYTIANFSATVLGATNGIYQVLEFYASNRTAISNGDYFAYFQNFTVTKNDSVNIVLNGLAGTIATKSEGGTILNTRLISINITDSHGRPLDDANMELKVSSPGHKSSLPIFRHMIFSLTGGVSRLPILNVSNVTLHIFNKRFAPAAIKLNITNSSLYPSGIIQVKMKPFNPRRFNPNGTIDEFNSSSRASDFRIIFMRNTAACSTYNASFSNCRLGNDDYDMGSFDPLKVMIGGKANIYTEINTTGVITYFIGVDMLASGPPQSDMGETHLSQTLGETRNQIWRFGSNAPDIFDRILLGIPYNESLFNESALFNLSLPYLLDEDNNLIWNATINTNGENIPDSYSDYNISWLNKSSGGMRCVDETGLNANIQQCYVNTTTNYVWVNIPHFSPDDDLEISGDPDTTPPVLAPGLVASNVSDYDFDGNIEINWTEPADETGETYAVFRYSGNITEYNSSLTNISPANRIGEGVGFFEDNTTAGNNLTIYWYVVVAVDAAGNINTTSGAANISQSLNATTNDTIFPKKVTGLNITQSKPTGTLTWLAVTQDVHANADTNNLQYKVYRSAVNATNINLSHKNVSSIMPSPSSTSTLSANTTTFSVSASETGWYHFIVTSIDDAGNENTSVDIEGPNMNYFNITLNENAGSSTTSSTTSSTGGSGSGGGGGGGSGSSTDSTEQSRLWDSLSAGSKGTFQITKEGIPFTLIEFTVTEDVTDVELTATKFLTRPSTAKKDYSGVIYQYVTIRKSNLKDTAVSSVKIKFKVPKSWLKEKEDLSTNVRLVRYDQNEWHELTTSVSNSDDTYFFYEALSPGLSLFAIALKPKISAATTAEADAVAKAAASAATNASEQGNATGTQDSYAKSKAGLYTALIVIVAALILGFFGFRSYKKSKNDDDDLIETRPRKELKN